MYVNKNNNNESSVCKLVSKEWFYVGIWLVSNMKKLIHRYLFL